MTTNRKGLNYSTKDYEGYRADMLAELKKKIPEYSDFSESDFGVVLIELLASQLDKLSYYNDKVANEQFIETAMERKSIAKLCANIGYTLSNATASEYEQVFNILPQDKDYTIPRGLELMTEASTSETIIKFETMEDLVIPKGCTGLETDDEGNYLYTVPIKQGYSVNSEIVGSSNGEASQTFKLGYAPVISDSIELYINEGVYYEKWNKVDSFLNSTSTSKDFTIFIDDDGSATIKFGNGVSGKVPSLGINNIMCNYRVGGGKVGNVGAKTITKMSQSIAEVVETFNPSEPKIYGKDKEDIEEARIKAPASIGIRYGLVTLNDFKKLAYLTRGVAKANAVSGRKPTIVIVYYLPDGTVAEDVLIQELLDSYDEKKLVGTQVILEKGKVRPINISVVAKTFSSYSALDVKNQIEVTLRNIIQLGNYDFAECPEQSDLVMELLDLEGVRAVDVYISNNDNIQNNEIISLGSLSIEMVGGR